MDISIFSPCSQKYHACEDYKKIDSFPKAIIGIVSALACLCFLFFGGVAVFRTLVNIYKRVDLDDTPTNSKVDTVRANVLPSTAPKHNIAEPDQYTEIPQQPIISQAPNNTDAPPPNGVNNTAAKKKPPKSEPVKVTKNYPKLDPMNLPKIDSQIKRVVAGADFNTQSEQQIDDQIADFEKLIPTFVQEYLSGNSPEPLHIDQNKASAKCGPVCNEDFLRYLVMTGKIFGYHASIERTYFPNGTYETSNGVKIFFKDPNFASNIVEGLSKSYFYTKENLLALDNRMQAIKWPTADEFTPEQLAEARKLIPALKVELFHKYSHFSDVDILTSVDDNDNNKAQYEVLDYLVEKGVIHSWNKKHAKKIHVALRGKMQPEGEYDWKNWRTKTVILRTRAEANPQAAALNPVRFQRIVDNQPVEIVRSNLQKFEASAAQFKKKIIFRSAEKWDMHAYEFKNFNISDAEVEPFLRYLVLQELISGFVKIRQGANEYYGVYFKNPGHKIIEKRGVLTKVHLMNIDDHMQLIANHKVEDLAQASGINLNTAKEIFNKILEQRYHQIANYENWNTIEFHGIQGGHAGTAKVNKFLDELVLKGIIVSWNVKSNMGHVFVKFIDVRNAEQPDAYLRWNKWRDKEAIRKQPNL